MAAHVRLRALHPTQQLQLAACVLTKGCLLGCQSNGSGHPALLPSTPGTCAGITAGSPEWLGQPGHLAGSGHIHLASLGQPAPW